MEEKSLDIYDDLQEIDREIVRYKIQYPAMTNTDMAKILKIDRTTLIKRLKKEQVQATIKEAQKTAIEIIIDLQTKAARRLGKLLKSEDETIQLAVAKEILKGVNPENHRMRVSHEDPEETMRRVYDKIEKAPETENEFVQ